MKSDRRIIIKIGTSTLTGGSSKIFLPGVADLVRQMAGLKLQGYEVILVSSGAIAAGREMFSPSDQSRKIPAKQMLAALGQPRLMEIYAQLFRIYGLPVAQVLLTRSDLLERKSYINARNTLTALLEQSIIPVINENDAVATEEIRVGDNDNLSALVANLVEADLLILLTDQPGLFTSDPRSDPGAKLIHEIAEAEIPAAIWKAAGGTSTGLGTGGMLTKIKAADLARRTGTRVVIAPGGERDVLERVVKGQNIGTTITALISKVESRKRYLMSGIKTSSSGVIVDAGACRAIREGSSLLPIGLVGVKGKFDRGEIVRIQDQEGGTVAIGIVNYDAGDVRKIIKHRSEEIDTLLGYNFGDGVIHRSNLVLI